MSATVPDVLLERLHRGELSEAEAAAVKERLAREGGLARLEALAASDREILAALPPQDVAREVRRRLAAAEAPVRKLHRASSWVWPPILAACATALAVFWLRPVPAPQSSFPFDDGKPEVVVERGGWKPLTIYLKEGEGKRKLEPGAVVRAGDTLQIRYSAFGKRYGVVASIDGAGNVTLHLPEGPGKSPALLPAAVLPHSFTLDNAPRFERFVFVTANEPFSTDVVVSALKAGSPPPAPLSQWDFVLNKETP